MPAAWEDSALKLHMIRDADWLAAAMYFLSGVIESSRQAALSDAKLQVMDRSLWSTLAVHYAHDPARMETLLPLFELAADRLAVPDLTIVLEADAATCRQRIARKSAAEQEFDAASPSDEAFHLREREFYHWLSDQGLNVVFLDANRGHAGRRVSPGSPTDPRVVAMYAVDEQSAQVRSAGRRLGRACRSRSASRTSICRSCKTSISRPCVAHKAKTAAEALGTPCLVDDAGCCWTPTPVFPAR